MSRHRLSDQQKSLFAEKGFLMDLPPLFETEEIGRLDQELPQLLAHLKPGESTKEIREWHESSLYLYELSMNEQVLDYVEDLLGANFYLWASNFFIKEAGTTETVGWHQDAYYWPLTPRNTVTVWLAFTDSNETNGAMQVIPGTHRAGLMKHARREETASVLSLELEEGTFSEDQAVTITLKAGEISIHDDAMVHGSPANSSDRPRTGFTMRYSTTDVKCDLSVNPHFKTYLCRGVDRYKLNPVGKIPTERFARLEREHVSIEEAGSDVETNFHTEKGMG